MLERADSYDAVCRQFRWRIPERYNIAVDVCDRHADAGAGTALIHVGADGSVVEHSFTDLKRASNRLANVLTAAGLARGDRVGILMPQRPETAIAHIAAHKAGLVSVPLFTLFGEDALAYRLGDCAAAALVTDRDSLPKIAAIRDRLPELKLVLVADEARDGGGWHALGPALEAASDAFTPVDTAADDPAVIIYTSGTTGQPKGVVRPTGGHLVALKWSMKNIYDVDPGDVYWAASDVGWVVGHSYIVYAPLFHGCTTVLYEGKPVGTPDAGAFWRVIADHRVKVMFTAPTAIRAIKKEDPDGKLLANYDLSHFRAQFLAGERCDPDTLKWCQDKLKVPAVDHWWQTETGWPIASNCLGIEELPYKPGSPTHPVPGWDVQVLAPEGSAVKPNEIGAISIKLPLPPGALSTLWNNDERFVQSYMTEYPGFYQTGDAGLIDDDGYLHVMTRTDDIINVAGHRLSTGGMEEVLASHPDVAECAVIGVADDLKGQVPLGFLVLKDGVNKPHDQVVKEVVALVRERIGPVAAFKVATVVQRLPKTRSGKILRGTMQKIADGQEPGMPATIDDPAILGEIAESLQAVGYAKKG